MSTVIGITGKKGSGKGEAARTLRDFYGFKEVNFADPLRQVVKIVFGLTDEEMTDRTLKERPLTRWPFMSPRQILQLTGTDAFRRVFPGVWIECFKREAAKWPYVVATDVRFLDEAEAIRSLGGHIIKVVRPGLASDENSNHVSELEMESIVTDAEVSNEGSILDLRSKMLRLINDGTGRWVPKL